MKNKTAMVTFAIVGGLVGGFVLSELIGVVGMLLFDKAIGIKYLPLILSLTCAAIAPLFVNRWNRPK